MKHDLNTLKHASKETLQEALIDQIQRAETAPFQEQSEAYQTVGVLAVYLLLGTLTLQSEEWHEQVGRHVCSWTFEATEPARELLR